MGRRLMMNVSSSAAPLYTLDQGSESASGGTTMTISGNHVKMNNLYSTVYCMYPKGHGSGAADNKPLWFTIPAGVSCSLKLLNIKNTNGGAIAVNFKKANSSTSGSFGTGNFNTSGTTEKIVTHTLEDDEDVGSIFIYPYASRTTVIEFDVEFWVGNVRYI